MNATPKRFYDARRCDVPGSVGQRIMQLMHLIRREVEWRMARHGLTDAQWKPLWMLESGRASTAHELAREMMVDAGAITRMLDRLEAKALVERLRSESDRRVVQLRLTPAGKAVVAKVPQVLAAVNNDFLRGFSEKEFEQLHDFIDRLSLNGQAMQQQHEEDAA